MKLPEEKLEALLRADTHVADEGFSERVLAALPAPSPWPAVARALEWPGVAFAAALVVLREAPAWSQALAGLGEKVPLIIASIPLAAGAAVALGVVAYAWQEAG